MNIAKIRWAAVVGALAAVPAGAQTCRYADLGVESLQCRDCHIQVDETRVRTFRTGTELKLNRIRVDGPTAGVLRDGDVLVAVDGAPITTAEGGRRFAALVPGRAATLTVRRDGLNRNVRIVPGAQCQAFLGAPPPPRPPGPPQARAPRPRIIERVEVRDVELIDAPPAPPPAPRPAPYPRPAPAPRAAPAPPPPPPPDFLPDGWFGFAIGCGNCEIRSENGKRSFAFRALPRVESVEPGTPAARAGMRRGDRLTHVDGLALTTPQAWQRFGAIQPGQRVRWSYDRNGRQETAELLAVRRPDARAAARASSRTAEQRLRYSGAVGDTDVEVRGAPVTVTRDPRTGETVIRSRDLTVRIRPDGTR